MQSDLSFGIWSNITFGAIILPGCLSLLHVSGCSHYPGSWGWHRDSIPSFSHSSQQSPPQHLHVVTGPLWQFGLQVYGPQPGWLELSHRVNLMSKCLFALTPEAANWQAVATQQQTFRISIFQVVFLQPGKRVFQVQPGIHWLSLHHEVAISQTVQMPQTHLRQTHWWGSAWFPWYQLSAELPIHSESPTHQKKHKSTSEVCGNSLCWNVSWNKKSCLSPTTLVTHSLHLSKGLSPSLISALYIELGNSSVQNTSYLHRQACYPSQFLHLPTSTCFEGVKSTGILITDIFFCSE